MSSLPLSGRLGDGGRSFGSLEKTMKRIGISLLALILLLALAGHVRADHGLRDEGEDVKVKLGLMFFDHVKGAWVDATGLDEDDPNHPSKPGSAIYVYHIKVTWDSLRFVYQVRDWQSEGKIYQVEGWNKENARIKVENRSNAPVDVRFKWDSKSPGTLSQTVKDATFTMSTAGGRLADASKTSVGLETTNTITPSGKGLEYGYDYQTFDRVVVSIDSAVGK